MADLKSWMLTTLCALVGAGMTAPCPAQGFVEHLEPPVFERGKTTRVTVVGSGIGKALDLWTTLPVGTLKASPAGESSAGRAVFDVTVAATAPVGVAGLRLATADGLGNAVLFLIDDLPVRPAPAAATPTKVALPCALWSRFREATVDRFAIHVSAGQRVSFEAVGNRLGKDVDPLLTIRDAQGRMVAERDNDPGLYFDCRFEHTFIAGGTYIVEMHDARFHGSEHGMYVLRMGRFPAARVAVPPTVRPGSQTELRLPELGQTVSFKVPMDQRAGLFFAEIRRQADEGSAWLPLEVGNATAHTNASNTLDQAAAVAVPGYGCGVLDKPGQRQFFRLDLAKGQKIQVRAEARAFNSPADLELAITDAKGKELRRVTENAKEEITLDFNAGNGGTFGLSVRDLNRDGGPAFAYRLDIHEARPEVHVTAEVEGLTVPRGNYQPVPLTVTRADYAGPIALTLVGGPPGLTLSPTVIEAGSNAMVCKLTATSDTPLGPHTVQLLAQAEALPEAAPVLVRTQPLIDRQIVNVDLIPHGLREDQRRLPPGLTDRFAVQVTPPAPFSVELPEPAITLGRYQHADFPIATTRVAGFTSPITFSAKGGQLAAKEEGRTRVYAELPEATAGRLQVTGSIHSKILTNLVKHRVELTAVGMDRDRRVALTRTFDLDIRSAFVVTAEPAKVSVAPGAATRVHLSVDRLKTFDGDVAVQLAPVPGILLPEEVVIRRGQTGLDVDIKVDPQRQPGRQNINLHATGVVNGFEEEQRGGRLEIEVVKMAGSKK